MTLITYLSHRRTCESKQTARAEIIANLPPAYHSDLAPHDREILNTPVADTARLVRKGEWKPIDILRAYGKQAVKAHAQTNCLTEVMIPEAEEWLAHSLASGEGGVGDGVNLTGPLAGIPVSFKDTVNVKGYDSCIGYSKLVGKPAMRDAPIVRLLKDAGAVPFVKTNVPVTLLSFESANDVWGTTENPHVEGYSPGGSTGGEAALLALGGSRIGVGTDVAGSVRAPAHYSGVYTVRCSVGRFPRSGNVTSMAGQEGVTAVYSPITKTMEDLSFFLKTVIEMKPWVYDHHVVPLPWRDVSDEMENKSVRWGVLRDDGIVTPSPACTRALDTVIIALKSQAHEVVELTNHPPLLPPLITASRLLTADGGATFSKHFQSHFESTDPGVRQFTRYFSLPTWCKFLHWAFVKYVLRDHVWAALIKNWKPLSAEEQWRLVAEREEIREQWFEYWNEMGLDYVLCVPNALPAVPHGGMKRGFASCGYTFFWNLLDYAAGVLPVTKVDKAKDALSPEFKINDNAVAKGAYQDYDVEKMHGLPLGVQVVARRFEEEKALWGMERVKAVLEDVGEGYAVLEC
ncbi:amidase signature enzyme [Choiromyces venosus 120613-1]|uniref:amidase n=1 Tax=Choiromyces venosus 120613-1 TaxID=1336337 RepID=A0A3N4K134_9PEZI|nr:amidase signature enzyme [Choiromyces venosus 120613-1]